MADLMREAYDLGLSKGIAAHTLQSIAEKAARGEAMQTPTADKQAVYDAYQNYYKQEVTKKAQAGQSLSAPTQWKNDIYNQALQAQAQQQVQQQQVQAQQPIQQQQQQVQQQSQISADMLAQILGPLQQQHQNPQSYIDIEAFMRQSQADSTARMQSLEQFLTQSSQAQIQAQQAQLGMARDQQLAEIEQSLQKAISDGQMSIREAEQQFKAAREQINQQAYTDSEITSLHGQQRGIQNSAQMIGLMQGDQARANSLLNQNVTTRDNQLNSINNQLAQMEYDANIGKSLANSQYNYGLAGAQAEIQTQLYNNLANMTYEEFARLQAQQSQFQQLGLQQQFNRENMTAEQMYALQQMGLNQQFGKENIGLEQLYSLQQMQQNQNYTQQNMGLEQQYALQQMAQNQNNTNLNMQTQHGFDLEKLSTQQKYTLEQMAKAQGYDLDKMSVQQQYTLAQMAQSFGYDMNLQSSQQNFQAGQNALDRNFEAEMQAIRQNHDITMLNEEQRVMNEQYYVELERKLRSVTKGTDEYRALEGEADFAFTQMARENQANFAAEIGATELLNLLGQFPKEYPDPYDKKAVDAFNSQTESVNKQITKLLGGEGAEQYIRDLAESKGKTAEEAKTFTQQIKDLVGKAGPIGYLSKKTADAITNYFTP